MSTDESPDEGPFTSDADMESHDSSESDDHMNAPEPGAIDPSQPGWGSPTGALETGQPGQPPPPGLTQPQEQAGYPAQYAPASPTNSSAIASMVCGIVGLTFCPLVLSVVALVLGYSARKSIRASGGHQQGGGMATAGIVTGWIGIVLWGAVAVFYVVILVIALVAGGSSSGL